MFDVNPSFACETNEYVLYRKPFTSYFVRYFHVVNTVKSYLIFVYSGLWLVNGDRQIRHLERRNCRVEDGIIFWSPAKSTRN